MSPRRPALNYSHPTSHSSQGRVKARHSGLFIGSRGWRAELWESPPAPPGAQAPSKPRVPAGSTRVQTCGIFNCRTPGAGALSLSAPPHLGSFSTHPWPSQAGFSCLGWVRTLHGCQPACLIGVRGREGRRGGLPAGTKGAPFWLAQKQGKVRFLGAKYLFLPWILSATEGRHPAPRPSASPLADQSLKGWLSGGEKVVALPLARPEHVSEPFILSPALAFSSPELSVAADPGPQGSWTEAFLGLL